jgi:hypothetical protein
MSTVVQDSVSGIHVVKAYVRRTGSARSSRG